MTDDTKEKGGEESEAPGSNAEDHGPTVDDDWGSPAAPEPDPGPDRVAEIVRSGADDSPQSRGISAAAASTVAPRSGVGEAESSSERSATGADSRSPSAQPEPEPKTKSTSDATGADDRSPEPADDWDAEPERDYAAEARAWRDDLQAAVGLAEAAEAAEKGGRKARRKPSRAERRRAKREAAGADDEDPQRSKRRLMIAVGIGILSVLIAVLIVAGYLNSRHYFFVCGAEQITAERGRTFPPWGQRRLSGKEWTPIEIPANTECASDELESQEQLEDLFGVALVEQAEARLKSGVPENVDVAEEQLMQALLLSRKPRPELRDRRKKIERLRGDVEYWRAAAQIEQVVQKLAQAGDQFQGAAERRPRLNSNASAWAEFARKMSEEIHRGPPALRDDRPREPGSRPPFADLVEPGTEWDGDAGPPPEERPDATPGVALPPEADAAPPPPDAGLPKGGVLL